MQSVEFETILRIEYNNSKSPQLHFKKMDEKVRRANEKNNR